MNGKLLKVAEYNLEFGSHDRFVNIIGCFKYKPNGNIYIAYIDVDAKYPIIYYGSGHIKETTILSMNCRNTNESEYIKEYIFKLINKEELTNFEILSLENVETIELIGSDKIEVKPEIINSLVNICLPKTKEDKIEEVTSIKTPKSKKKSGKSILIILLLVIIVIIGYFLINSLSTKNNIVKKIICQKEYSHDTLDANVHEENTYNFNVKDTLESINTTMTYQFDENAYQDFIMKGTYYKYLPADDEEGSYNQDNENYTFKITKKQKLDTSYNKPTAYEEVFSYYKKEGYTCTEEIGE